jgi:very-short-patch-repair endonuclease
VPTRSALSAELRSEAERQWGLLSTPQLLSWLGPGAVSSLVTTGALERLEPGIYRLAGAPRTFRQRAMAAALSYGPPVAVSHGSAARLWGFYELGLGPVEVTLPPGRSGRRRSSVAHRLRIDPGDAVERFAIPVTTPVRTLLDLATGPWGSRLLGRLIDDLLRSGHLGVRDLQAGLLRSARHPGHGALYRLAEAHLEAVSPTDRRPGSPWEQDVRRLLHRSGLPPTVPQHPVTIGGRTYWIDLAIPELKIAIEFDGYEYHSGRGRFDEDRRRWSELQLAGWLVVTVTSRHSEAEIVDRVRRAVAARTHAMPSPADR